MPKRHIHFVAGEAGWYYGIYASAGLSTSQWSDIYALLGATGPHETLVQGRFVGVQGGTESPWSTSVRDIMIAIGISQVQRVERFRAYTSERAYDLLLETCYEGLSAGCFAEAKQPADTEAIADLAAYNKVANLALDEHELAWLLGCANKLGRVLSDTEVFGWAQIQSEHCRHKTFSSRFVIEGKPAERSLFDWIKATTAAHPNKVISAYKDNVAFFTGPRIKAFLPTLGKRPSLFKGRSFAGVISLKAETHNFPTTVEPFYGAGTGTGGEIRDRMAGGRGSLPLAGTAVYMTPYARIGQLKPWEKAIPSRKWRYQKPDQLLIKASNGASDYANKFGQPLIAGSLLTFECKSGTKLFAYDKVVMLAGGVGMTHAAYAHKQLPRPGDLLLLLGGSNYRIGMGGGTISSVGTGNHQEAIEKQAVQRANPEMQRRVADCIRALVEGEKNPIRSIHDHGAGGHLNCFIELLEGYGGDIYLDALPMGDTSLSYKELLCNESQERMGVLIAQEDLPLVKAVATRACCPLYVVGKVRANQRIRCLDRRKKRAVPVDMPVAHFIHALPQRTTHTNSAKDYRTGPLQVATHEIYAHAAAVLQLEGVACKDWLTTKVDRCVGGCVAMQPCCGPLQLPLNNLGVVGLDFEGLKGIGTSLGHAPGAALIDAGAGSRLAIAEALTNLVWAPLTHGLQGISCSANWMWPQGEGEGARLYKAVAALSQYAMELGVNIPTGKDSLAMQQQYPTGEVVAAPGTLILSAVAEVCRLNQLVSPVMQAGVASELIYVSLGKDYHLGGSALAQTCSQLGDRAPEPLDAKRFAVVFTALQVLVEQNMLLAGHDVGSGGLLVTLLELCFASTGVGMDVDFSLVQAPSLLHVLFSESPAVVLQVAQGSRCRAHLDLAQVDYLCIGATISSSEVHIQHQEERLCFDVSVYRRLWFATSAHLDALQRPAVLATERAEKLGLGLQPLRYRFPKTFTGRWPRLPMHRKQATILREKGSNSDREIAYVLHKAGFQVQDMHMSDLMMGRGTLDGTDFLVFVGGFSHADVLGAARGWAATFRKNRRAKQALKKFYTREDVLSLGICNGCQLMGELNLLGEQAGTHPRLRPNTSQQFECAFVALELLTSPSVLFRKLAGAQLGAWVAHGEGRFVLPTPNTWPVVARYAYSEYPGNPNGSDLSAACLCSADGRHNAIMPHIERAFLPCNWAHYPPERKNTDDVSPWIMPFLAARAWFT